MDTFIEDYLRNGDKSDYVVTQEPIYLPEDVPYAGSTLWGSSHIEIHVRRDVGASSRSP